MFIQNLFDTYINIYYRENVFIRDIFDYIINKKKEHTDKTIIAVN